MARNLRLVDGSTAHEFRIAETEKHLAVRRETVPWEYERFGRGQAWRIPLHPFTGGLNIDRFGAKNSYAKANADASNENILYPPPKLNALTLTSSASTPTKMLEFDGLMWILCGTLLFSVTLDDAFTVASKDLNTDFGAAGVDMCVFDDYLVVCFGASAKIARLSNAGTWAQASDNVYAHALEVVDNRLWRGHDTNQMDSVEAGSSPLTAANWTTAAYKVGDTTKAIFRIRDYGGVPWVRKADGVYQADPATRFHNQTPQIKEYPGTAKNMFTAGGALWAPAETEMLRLRLGQSLPMGPELTHRPGYQFTVWDGVEWNGAIYLAVEDGAGSANSFICKMLPRDDAPRGHDYAYHEWVRIGSTNTCRAIAVSSTPTNPILFHGDGNNAAYEILGRGGQRDVDDANYAYGTAWELESGQFSPSDDLSIVNTLVGVTATLKNVTDASVTLSAAADDQSYTNLLDTQDGGGSAAIGATTNWEAVTRYAAAGTQGQFFQVKLAGTQTGTVKGTASAQLRELWAFGYQHPKKTDVMVLALYLGASLRGSDGKSPEDIAQQFRHWEVAGTTLTMTLPDYARGDTVRVIVTNVKEDTLRSFFGPGLSQSNEKTLVVELTRIDLGGTFDDAA